MEIGLMIGIVIVIPTATDISLPGESAINRQASATLVLLYNIPERKWRNWQTRQT